MEKGDKFLKIQKDNMNVMYAADDNFAEIMGVSILSLLKNNTQMSNIDIYIVEDGISEDNIRKIKDMVEAYHRKVFFIKKPDISGILGVELKTTSRWSESIYSRLFLEEVLQKYKSVKKLLYLDSDTMIVSSLQKLWETDIRDCLGAACLECMSNMHKRMIGAKKTDNYINSGMLLLNVEKWIDDNIEAKVLGFIKKCHGKGEYPDQGAINGTISNQFKLVDPRYNLTALAYDFTYDEMQIYRKPQFGYSKEEWEKAVENPVIIHFTTSFLSIRPWYKGSEHPYAKIWQKYHQESPWKDATYREIKNRKSRDKKEQLYHKLPRPIAVRIAGFLHAYVKPIVHFIR